MNYIEIKKITHNLIYDNTVILKYTIEYPQIINSQYILGQRNFNTYNLKIVNDLKQYIFTELYSSAKDIYKYNKENDYPIMVFEVYVSCNITENYNNIVSLYTDKYIFEGGAHGTTIRTSQNWDLAVGMQFDLSRLFPNNQYYIINILKEINKQIKEQIEKEGENIYFKDYCQLVLENFNLKNFYMFPNYFEVFFQQYDIAPYSTGIPTFKIKYNI